MTCNLFGDQEIPIDELMDMEYKLVEARVQKRARFAETSLENCNVEDSDEEEEHVAQQGSEQKTKKLNINLQLTGPLSNFSLGQKSCDFDVSSDQGSKQEEEPRQFPHTARNSPGRESAEPRRAVAQKPHIRSIYQSSGESGNLFNLTQSNQSITRRSTQDSSLLSQKKKMVVGQDKNLQHSQQSYQFQNFDMINNGNELRIRESEENQSTSRDNHRQDLIAERVNFVLPKLEKVESILDGFLKQTEMYQSTAANGNGNGQKALPMSSVGVQQMADIMKCNIHSVTPQHKNEKFKKTAMVLIGHQNWNLVVNMMMGIQMAVKSASSILDKNVSDHDYKLKYYFELLPKRQVGEQ